MTELVPVHFIGIDERPEDDSESIDREHIFHEIRAIKRKHAERYDLDVVERGDAWWDQRFKDLSSGDVWRVDELT